MAETTLTGMPEVDKLIRGILGKDDGAGDGDGQDGGEWEGVTALGSLAPNRLDAVDVPASGYPWLVLKAARRKGKDGPSAAGMVVKASEERRYTLVCAYPADRPDRAVASDGFRDFAPAGALQDAAWNFLRKGGTCGLMHKNGTEHAGEVVESYLWPGEDWTMTAADGSVQTIRKGDWMAGIIWSPGAWQAIKRGELRGVSMQGGASRRKPTAGELAGLRKSAKPPKCGKCGKKARRADARYCAGCGRPLVKAAKPPRVLKAQAALAKATAAEASRTAVRVGRDLDRARSADPAVRGEAFGRLAGEFGAGTAVRLLSGEVTPAGLGVRAAKAAVAQEAARCKTCSGGGRLRHPATGKASRTCPSCQGSGKWTPGGDKADMTGEDASLFREAAAKARSRGMDAPDGLGTLIALVGADVAMKVMTGGKISPGEFRRGYITACRANQSAKPSQQPRIPDATHVPRAEDFTRPALTVRQARPAPASAWPGQGGQADYYQGGAGIGPDTAAGQRPPRGPASVFVTPGLAAPGRAAG